MSVAEQPMRFGDGLHRTYCCRSDLKLFQVVAMFFTHEFCEPQSVWVDCVKLCYANSDLFICEQWFAKY